MEEDDNYKNCNREYNRYFEEPSLRGKIRAWEYDGCRGKEIQISDPIRDLSSVGYDQKMNSMIIPPEFGAVYIAGGNDLSREIVRLDRNKRILTTLDGSNSKRGNLFNDEVSSIFFDKVDYWPNDPNAQSREITGWNMPYFDIKYVNKSGVDGGSCKKLCDETANCTSTNWFDSQNPDGSWKSECWLKNGFGKMYRDHDNMGMNMYIKSAPSNVVLPPIQLRSYDRDYIGGSVHQQNVANLGECERLCWDRNDCKISVFREGDKKCFIKNNLGGHRHSPGHTSTVKGPLIDKQPYKPPLSIIKSQPIAYSGYDLKSAYSGSAESCRQWCEDTPQCGASSYNNDTGECTLLRDDVNEEGARSNNVGNSYIQIKGQSENPFTLDNLKDACCLGGNYNDNKMIGKERCGPYNSKEDRSTSDACRLRMTNICKVRGPNSILKTGGAAQAAEFNACFDWCDKNPVACDKVKFDYCNEELKKPQAERDSLCSCLNYNDDPEFIAIKAKYQSSLNKPNPAGGYKKDCLVPSCSQKTDRYDTLIDSDTIIAKRTTSCPPIVTIDNSIQVNGNNNILSNISQSGTVSLQFTTNTHYDAPDSYPPPPLNPPKPGDPAYTGAGAPPILINDNDSKLSEGPLKSDNSQSTNPDLESGTSNPDSGGTSDPESGGGTDSETGGGTDNQKIMGINKKVFIFIIVIISIILVALFAFYADSGENQQEFTPYQARPTYPPQQMGLQPRYL